MKGANRQMRIIIIFQKKKKKMIGANGPFWAQKWCMLITLNPLSEFFKILHIGKGQQKDESTNGLFQRNFVHDKWAILGTKMAHPHNSGSAVRMFLKFCRMKGASRYMKILLVIFREKHFG